MAVNVVNGLSNRVTRMWKPRLVRKRVSDWRQDSGTNVFSPIIGLWDSRLPKRQPRLLTDLRWTKFDFSSLTYLLSSDIPRPYLPDDTTSH